MEKYKSFISKTNYVAFLALLASLPFPQPFIHFFWIIWIVTWLLEFRFLDKSNIQTNRGVLYLCVGVFIWLIWNIISVLWADNTQAVWNTTMRYVSLLTIPIAGVFGVNKHYNWYNCFKVLMVSSFISIGVYIFTHYWLVNYAHAFNKHTTRPLIEIDWLHMDNLLLSIKHRMHYANLLCMLFPSLFIICTRSKRIPVIICSILLLIAIYMTGSRVALIYLVVLAVITVCWFVLRQRKTWIKGIGVGVAVIIIVVGSFFGMLLHPRNAGHSISELFSVNTENIESPAFEPRFAIWHTALEQPNDYIKYGLGAGNATDYLVNRYQELGWKNFASKQYSPHNQYLSVCIDLGLAAAILFTLFWLGLPLMFKGTQRYWILCFTGICMSSMMTDMLLGGLEGVVFVSVMFVLTYLLPTRKKEETL